jgi:hypothetical protein
MHLSVRRRHPSLSLSHTAAATPQNEIAALEAEDDVKSYLKALKAKGPTDLHARFSYMPLDAVDLMAGLLKFLAHERLTGLWRGQGGWVRAEGWGGAGRRR